jgi:LmbE family N-acetylglucosaminyl deacetylase
LSRDEGFQPYKVHEVYVAGAQHPNIEVDVTSTFKKKIRALSEHKSQIRDIEALEERLKDYMRDDESPPDDPRFIERFRRIELR